ncbi:hypothetical protein [Neoroseomonas lacus]|uniref:Uncharacterized protein n=1 Tax=Neoroseomonas lacus TaxID=287609 RepID=A0A917KHA1_9PROT|nr:hypothetical protein [Neoroseomonas lacus]GGJ13993.1 hypothetical protein GCM10011320_21540 [Neoroseomonas lacus]
MNDTPVYPAGDFAIVELFGHTTLIGRIAEVERFGAKMMALEPLFANELLPAVFHGGASIYRLTPCTAEVAFARQPREAWQLPAPIRCIVPAGLLPAPEPRGDIGADEDEEDVIGPDGFPL